MSLISGPLGSGEIDHSYLEILMNIFIVVVVVVVVEEE